MYVLRLQISLKSHSQTNVSVHAHFFIPSDQLAGVNIYQQVITS